MEMLNLLRKDFTAGAIFLLGVIIIIPFMSTIAMAAKHLSVSFNPSAKSLYLLWIKT